MKKRKVFVKNGQQNKKNKKKTILLATLIPLGVIAATAAIVTPLVISCANKNSINVELIDSPGVKIKESKIEKGKDSTITLDVPSTKEIDTLEIKVDGKTLTKGTDYTLEGNVIKINGKAVTGNISIKVLTVDRLTVTLTSDSSKDVSIKSSDVHKNKDSSITLNIPDGKEIDILEIKVGEETLTKGTDYTINNNVINITGSVVTDNISIKVIVKAIQYVYDLSYSSTDKKYQSSDITVKPNSSITFNIKIDEKASNVATPQTFCILDDSSNIVEIAKVDSVTIKGESYKEYTLKDNKIDLGDLTEKRLAKDNIITIVLTTANSSDVKAKALCDPYVWTPYIEMCGNKPFNLSVMDSTKHWNGQVEYSTDKSAWTPWDGKTPIQVGGSGSKYCVYLRGKGNTSFTDGSGASTTFTFSEDEGLEVSLNGNIMTLLDYDDPDNATMGDSCFASLFLYGASLISIPKLPATKLSKKCYSNMFNGCTKLKTLPAGFTLPATTLAEYCYDSMFMASGLTSLPENLLPATTLTEGCYSQMFGNCTGLIGQLPENLLPADALANDCYNSMFSGCTGITSTPQLPAENIKYTTCYAYMFYNCSQLTTIGKFGNGKAITISGDGACMEMFGDCSNLSVAVDSSGADPHLFMKTASIVDGSVGTMFRGCKSQQAFTEPKENTSYKYVIE